MKVFWFIFLISVPKAIANSNITCNEDANCGFYPEEIKECKDKWQNCFNLRTWCHMFRAKMILRCQKTCRLCKGNQTCNCGEWQPWSECSRTCNAGEMYRSRFCNSTNECGLITRQARVCNTKKCIRWSECSVSCGGGSRRRFYNCETEDCIDKYEDCNTDECPSRPCGRNEVHRYNSSSSCCHPSSVLCGEFQISSNIIGGVEAKPHEFQWTLLIQIIRGSQRFFCGGALISDIWTLTAAHCVVNADKNNLLVIAGIRHIRDPGHRVPVRRIIIHPEFNMPYADLALIKLASSLDVTPQPNPHSDVKVICLPRGEKTQVDAKCYAAGWGATNPVSHYLSPTLQIVKLRNLGLQPCRKAYKDGAFGGSIDNSMICAGTHSGLQDTCVGDSGGPLMCQRCSSCSWYLAGITSFGPNPCATPGFPGVYTKILEHELWIEDETGTIFEESLWKHSQQC